MIPIPDDGVLDAIKAQCYSGSILSKQIGPYRLSCIYRQSSAAIESAPWYPETMIFEGEWGKDEEGRINKWPRIRWQGEGWASFLNFANNIETVEHVEDFLEIQSEDE